MAIPTLALIGALRETAKRLEEGAQYAWGNHGSCNCGNLLQVITDLSKEEILTYAHTEVSENGQNWQKNIVVLQMRLLVCY